MGRTSYLKLRPGTWKRATRTIQPAGSCTRKPVSPSRVQHAGRVWVSPGISTERLDMYLAPYSAGERVSAGGGFESENENLTVMEVPLAELWALVQAKRITDLKTLTLILMLHTQELQLFAAI